MKNYKGNIISLAMIIAGAVLAAFSIEEFLSPNKIFDGGVTGASMILVSKIPVSLGIMVVLLNIPFFMVGYKRLGRVFIVKSVVAIATFSLSLSVFESMEQITRDPLLATIFGALFLGCGVGLVLRAGGCLDGTEIVGILVSRKSDFSTGRVVLLINVVIYFVAGLIFGIDSGMYSMVMYFITSKVIDIVDTGMNGSKAVMMVTTDGRKAADEIYNRLGRTVTFLRGEGLVSGSGKDVLYCVVSRAEISELKTIIKSLDASSFTTVTDITEVIGNHIKSTKKPPVNEEE